MISGREAITKFWSELMPAGDGVVEIGQAAPTSGGQMEVKYVVFWKVEDGRWKWHVDIWNTNA